MGYEFRPLRTPLNYFRGVPANQLYYKNLKTARMKLWDTCVPELCQYLWGNISVYPIGKVRAIVPVLFVSNLLFHYKVFTFL